MVVNERILYLRKKILNLSQEEFSSKINVSRSNIGNIEIGRISPTDRVINDICREFSVNKEWILDGEEPVFNDGEDSSVNEIIEAFKNLNNDKRNYLKGYIFRLLEEQNAEQ